MTSQPHHDEAHAADEPHGAGDHGETDGHDDHGHAEEAPGPMDWGTWAVGALGVAFGLVVALAVALSTGAVSL